MIKNCFLNLTNLKQREFFSAKKIFLLCLNCFMSFRMTSFLVAHFDLCQYKRGHISDQIIDMFGTKNLQRRKEHLIFWYSSRSGKMPRSLEPKCTTK